MQNAEFVTTAPKSAFIQHGDGCDGEAEPAGTEQRSSGPCSTRGGRDFLANGPGKNTHTPMVKVVGRFSDSAG